jgi:hypothetical protein
MGWFAQIFAHKGNGVVFCVALSGWLDGFLVGGTRLVL